MVYLATNSRFYITNKKGLILSPLSLESEEKILAYSPEDKTATIQHDGSNHNPLERITVENIFYLTKRDHSLIIFERRKALDIYQREYSAIMDSSSKKLNYWHRVSAKKRKKHRKMKEIRQIRDEQIMKLEKMVPSWPTLISEKSKNHNNQ